MSSAARPFWVGVHRWAGLATALFLCVAGLTGSMLAFKEDLDAWLNPQWFMAPAQGRDMLDPFALRDEVAGQLPWAAVDQVPPGLSDSPVPRRSTEMHVKRFAYSATWNA